MEVESCKIHVLYNIKRRLHFMELCPNCGKCADMGSRGHVGVPRVMLGAGVP